MKRLLLLVLVSSFLFGCGAAATKSEFWQHETMYRNWDHAKFSLWEYKNPNAQTYKSSVDQKWWGIDTPYIPAE